MGRPGAAAVASPVISRRQVWALVALTLMWGVNWPMMKLSLRELTPMYFRAITMTGGALWLYLFFRARGIRMAPQGAEWRAVADRLGRAAVGSGSGGEAS